MLTTQIIGTFSNGIVDPIWTYTTEEAGYENRWRKLANGRRVFSVPIWLFCDDTSGNVSKRWNEHNSFLFTLAGLPRHLTLLEYMVHFICTSNSAAVLEMLDGVVEQLE